MQSQKEYQALSNILMEISKYIIDNEMTSIAIDEVKQSFKIYLNDRNLDIDAELLFNKMIKRCEIMAIDYNKNTLFFKHRTFAEFLYAKLHSTNHELKIDKRAFELYWMNIFFFYLGILKDCPEYVDVLINMEVSSEPQRLLKIINMANYFLAAYTTPYKFIVNGLMKTMIEAALLYKDIIDGNIDSPFATLPRMHVLCIFQIFIRQSYSYEFLRKAMEEVALEINYSDNDDEIKAYSLFFLNVAYIDISPNQSFDFLLKEHLGKLPIDLSLALFHEFNNIKERTLLMKKHEKYLKKLLKGNKSLISYMHKIYELSIKSLLDSQKKK